MDLAGKIMNTCNNFVGEHQLIDQNVSFALRSSPAALKKAPFPRYMEAVTHSLTHSHSQINAMYGLASLYGPAKNKTINGIN